MAVAWVDTPRRLITLACLGGVVSIVAVRAAAVWAHASPSVLPAACCLILLVGGLCVLYAAAYRLREGVRSERWDSAEIGPLQTMVRHPVFRFVMLPVLLLAFLMLFNTSLKHVFFWPFLIFTQTVSQVQSALIPLKSIPPRPPIWKDMKPIHSDHWGER